ncbi:MAG: WG repeat-containing protein [Deltaproteobacteria bacterium]|nr:WG repeat-containing protein [Deltaproteobacteria bacterium]
MRRFLGFMVAAAFLLCSAPGYLASSQDFLALFPIQQHGEWGFIDRTGKVVIPPQFRYARAFHEGRAAVQVGDRFDFIDETGKVVIQAQFDRVEDFADGLAKEQLEGKQGFVDLSANLPFVAIFL